MPSIANLSDPNIEAALEMQSRELLALLQTQAQVCTKTMGDELRYMSSTAVVRDMAFMAEVFDGKGAKMYVQILRYQPPPQLVLTDCHDRNLYTGSYGSVLGTYLVQMFVFLSSTCDILKVHTTGFLNARAMSRSTVFLTLYYGLVRACVLRFSSVCQLST